MSLVGFSIAVGSRNLDDAARATLLADRLLLADDRLRSMAFAVGLATDDRKALCIMVLANNKARISGLEGDAARRLPEAGELYTAFQALFVPDAPSRALEYAPWLDKVWVTPTLPPVLHAGPNENVSSTPSARQGKIGTNVSWTGGIGYLVAGHVADAPPGGFMTDSHGNLGTINYHSDPTNQGNSILEDVAVVSFGGSHMRLYKALAPSLGPDTVVTVKTSRAGAAHSVVTTIKGEMRYAKFDPPVNGTWGDLYYASPCVTQLGDSGAPVEDGKGNLVGHVVAGNGYTYIQIADYQLSQIRKKSSAHAQINV